MAWSFITLTAPQWESSFLISLLFSRCFASHVIMCMGCSPPLTSMYFCMLSFSIWFSKSTTSLSTFSMICSCPCATSDVHRMHVLFIPQSCAFPLAWQ